MKVHVLALASAILFSLAQCEKTEEEIKRENDDFTKLVLTNLFNHAEDKGESRFSKDQVGHGHGHDHGMANVQVDWDSLETYLDRDSSDGVEMDPEGTTDEPAAILEKPSASSSELIVDKFNTMFYQQRNEIHDRSAKMDTRQKIYEHYKDLGLEVITQSFSVKYTMNNVTYRESGVNLIGVLPGKFRGQAGESLFTIGGHYDTVRTCPGVDDNGSGSVATLEAARLLSPYRGKLNHTIYFVLFDLEELGLIGSMVFTRYYLVPTEVVKNGNFLTGAYIMDMMLTYDPNPGSQLFPDYLASSVPEAARWSEQNDDKGDFVSVWSRKHVDDFLYSRLAAHWDPASPYKLLLLDPELPATNPTKEDFAKHGTFMRSDHGTFWYHGNKNYNGTLNAVLLCDMGPWRGLQQTCYHSECDDLSQLTDENVGFMRAAIDAVVRAVFSMTSGQAE